MNFEYPIYEDSVMAVKLSAENMSKKDNSLFHLAIRYLKPQDTEFKNGDIRLTTNIMGDEIDWFILPYSFGVAVAKSLIEQKISGLDYFIEVGFRQMVNWLIEMEEIKDSMCY